MLSGAESALAQLHAGMAAGLDARELKELSVTANVLMRAAKLIEDDKPVEEPRHSPSSRQPRQRPNACSPNAEAGGSRFPPAPARELLGTLPVRA